MPCGENSIATNACHAAVIGFIKRDPAGKSAEKKTLQLAPDLNMQMAEIRPLKLLRNKPYLFRGKEFLWRSLRVAIRSEN